MGRYCKPLEVYLHRNSSDLPFVIAELARLSKHSEWLRSAEQHPESTGSERPGPEVLK